jgi:DNA polymerase-3 subunit delta'
VSLLPWHQPLASRIEALISSGKLPHGLLISATEGWGEVIFAQWLALRLLEQPLTANASEIAHPDLRWLKPDGAEIKVDAIRAMGEFAFKTSQLGLRKVAVLEDAHLLNRNAANALLKTLEEPPAGTFVILASCHAGRLLPTIASRCQRFVIDIDAASARDWLAQQWDPDDIDERLAGQGGAPLLVARELTEGNAPLVRTLADIAASTAPLGHLDTLLAQDPGHITGGWYRHINALLGRACDAADGGSSARKLLEFADELLWVRHQLLNTNSANARLLMGRLVVKWHGLGT